MPRSPSLDAAVVSEAAVIAAIQAVARRLQVRQVLISVTMVLALAAAGLLLGHVVAALAAGLTAASVAFLQRRREWSRAAAAKSIERAGPGCRNVVITAEELLRHPERTASWMRSRVMTDAAARATSVPLQQVVPLRLPLGLVFCAVSVCVVAALFTPSGRTASDILQSSLVQVPHLERLEASAPLRIVVTITPPPYAGKPPQQHQDPPRIEALEGSTLRLAISGPGPGWRVRSGAGVLPASGPAGQSVVETVVGENGYLAIEPVGSPEGAAAARDRRLIPVTMIPDHAPTVRVEDPGHDLVVADATRTIAIRAAASDDIGLRSLEIRYTKVSGSGEQFAFEEGALPLTIGRDTSQAWTGTARVSMAALKLVPGDALVYRAVARDARPGDKGLASSDTFVVEIAGPGQLALDGLEMPPSQQRYALSQQMIVLDIQRLRARERRLSREILKEAADSIATRQRAVRANFVFLMGGHVEDGAVGPEPMAASKDVRLENTAEQEMNAAGLHMGRVEVALAGVDTSTALAEAKAAVAALQRALGRSRYILRTIPVGSRIDPSRRLTGELSGARDWRREIAAPASDRELGEARILLSRILEIASLVNAGGSVDPSRFLSIAEQALAIGPGLETWQRVSAQLQAIARAQDGTPRTITEHLSEAAAPVIARIQRGGRIPPEPGTRSPAALEGAWVREFKR
jgi:hypothetical protein